MHRLFLLVQTIEEVEKLRSFFLKRKTFFELKSLYCSTRNSSEKKNYLLSVVSHFSFPDSIYETTYFKETKAETFIETLKACFPNERSREEKLIDSSPLIKKQQIDLLRLITLKNIPSEFQRKLLGDGILLKERYVTFILFDFDKEEELLDYYDYEKGRFSLEKGFEEHFADYPYFIFEFSTLFGVLLSTNEPINRFQLENKLSSVIFKSKSDSNLSFSCAVSETAFYEEGDFSCRKLFKEAEKGLTYRPILGKGLVLFYEDLIRKEKSVTKIAEVQFQNLGYALLYGKKLESLSLLRGLLRKIGRIDYRDNYLLLLNQLLNSLLNSCISLGKLYETYESYFALLKMLYSKKGKESILAFFEELLKKISLINQNSKQPYGKEKALERITLYIEKHFMESSLSIEELSKELGYSHSYIYALFKKSGTTFIKTLTKFRMEEAKRLLADPSNRIVQIASKVGYDDPYYFSTCFKKYFGSSPIHLRKLENL